MFFASFFYKKSFQIECEWNARFHSKLSSFSFYLWLAILEVMTFSELQQWRTEEFPLSLAAHIIVLNLS